MAHFAPESVALFIRNNQLRNEKRLDRIGSDKDGYWLVLHQNSDVGQNEDQNEDLNEEVNEDESEEVN